MLQRPVSPGNVPKDERVDIDFSLAIHNRTGKYFVGRDLLETEDLPIGDVYYWTVRSREPLTGLFGRIVGRLQLHHIKGHALGGPLRLLPRRVSARPLLHLDPFTVASAILRRKDAVLCHDLGPLTHPQLFDEQVSRIYRPIYDEIARVGPHLIFVSRSSLEQFRSMYPGASPASTRVIYNALRGGAILGTGERIAGIRPPFLLTVGSIGCRKNQLSCIEAFARSGLVKAGISYVLCGPKEPGFDEVSSAAQCTPGVHLLPYVSDGQLNWLYRSASGFVLMSLLEGFGMPVAEAIRAGLVPLVTKASVLEEVAGKDALRARAEKVDEIASGMTLLAHMTSDERSQRLQGLRQSVSRFEPALIREQWRTAFSEILSNGA